MPLVPVTEATFPTWEARLQRLTADTTRLWGSMDSTQMLNHVRSLVLISLEQNKEKDFSNALTRSALVKYLLITIPWPKGKIKAPVRLQVGDPAEFAEELELLKASLREFTAAEAAEPGRLTRSPMVGPVPLSYWAKLHGKHLDHHLRQFGA